MHGQRPRVAQRKTIGAGPPIGAGGWRGPAEPSGIDGFHLDDGEAATEGPCGSNPVLDAMPADLEKGRPTGVTRRRAASSQGKERIFSPPGGSVCSSTGGRNP